jgi:hypothetical protein
MILAASMITLSTRNYNNSPSKNDIKMAAGTLSTISSPLPLREGVKGRGIGQCIFIRSGGFT